MKKKFIAMMLVLCIAGLSTGCVKIIDKGTHNELKERCSLYKEILSSQLENMGGSL